MPKWRQSLRQSSFVTLPCPTLPPVGHCSRQTPLQPEHIFIFMGDAHQKKNRGYILCMIEATCDSSASLNELLLYKCIHTNMYHQCAFLENSRPHTSNVVWAAFFVIKKNGPTRRAGGKRQLQQPWRNAIGHTADGTAAIGWGRRGAPGAPGWWAATKRRRHRRLGGRGPGQGVGWGRGAAMPLLGAAES